MKISKNIYSSIVVLISFFLLRYLKYFFAYIIWEKSEWNTLDVDFRKLLILYSQIIVVLIVTTLIFRKSPFRYLGLKNDFSRSLLFAFLFSLPMIIGYAIQSGFHFQLTFEALQKNLIFAGFYEELAYRGFLFGLLYFYFGWGFLSAVLIPSVFFGLGHLYQAGSINEGIGIFVITSLVNVGFAWFYVAWNSLWMAIFLHGFMDLIWDVFNIEGNVIGNLYANIFRVLTIALAVYFSIREAKKNNSLSLKGKLWQNPAGASI